MSPRLTTNPGPLRSPVVADARNRSHIRRGQTSEALPCVAIACRLERRGPAEPFFNRGDFPAASGRRTSLRRVVALSRDTVSRARAHVTDPPFSCVTSRVVDGRRGIDHPSLQKPARPLGEAPSAVLVRHFFHL